MRATGFVIALALALLLAGCATQGFGGNAMPSNQAASMNAQPASSPATITNFSLRVRCPGVHLEKTQLGWSDRKIMEHESVTKHEIAQCEAWAAAQPKGYVPALHTSADPGPWSQAGKSAGPRSISPH